jgi:hypothetical protein
MYEKNNKKINKGILIKINNEWSEEVILLLLNKLLEIKT